MAQVHTAHDAGKYYIPHGSKWPIIGSVSLFVTMLGAAAMLNGVEIGPWLLLGGLLVVFYMFYGWFGTVIGESQAGMYNQGVDKSFRMGMMWFIFSEVMFFAAFFGALYYARQLSVPWLGGEGSKFLSNLFLWKEYEPAWPRMGRQMSAAHSTSSPPSAFQPSIPPSCSPRASRSRSRTTPSRRAIAAC
jgi:cytochrome c oxidase subunit III